MRAFIVVSVGIRDILSFSRVLPVVAIEDPAHALPLARALASSGLRVIEITVHAPATLAAVESIRKSVPEAIVGVGALARAADFAAAGRAGAQFGATPGWTPELAPAARGARFPVLPGVMTPSEVIAARLAGFELARFFPAHLAGGVALLKALGSQFPDMTFCPAGALDSNAAREYLALPNVACVGGDWMAPPALRAAGDWSGIASRAREAAALQ
jgi:2-dehydro-3-deoxyphosphogluconate aldolase/(4S)-4-hydroxy-2-oxoglutarate aldolase